MKATTLTTMLPTGKSQKSGSRYQSRTDAIDASIPHFVGPPRAGARWIC
jgi:hypothetical protein